MIKCTRCDEELNDDNLSCFGQISFITLYYGAFCKRCVPHPSPPWPSFSMNDWEQLRLMFFENINKRWTLLNLKQYDAVHKALEQTLKNLKNI